MALTRGTVVSGGPSGHPGGFEVKGVIVAWGILCLLFRAHLGRKCEKAVGSRE